MLVGLCFLENKCDYLSQRWSHTVGRLDGEMIHPTGLMFGLMGYSEEIKNCMAIQMEISTVVCRINVAHTLMASIHLPSVSNLCTHQGVLC